MVRTCAANFDRRSQIVLSKAAQTRSLIWRGSWVMKPRHVLSLLCFHERIQISLQRIVSPTLSALMEGLLLNPAVPAGRNPVSRLGPYLESLWRPSIVTVFAEGVYTVNATTGPQPALSCFVFSREA